MDNSPIKKILENKVSLVFFIFLFFTFQSLAYFTLWTETELYPTHSSQYLFTAFHYEFLFALKPIFYSLLKISFLFSQFFNITPMTMARFVFACNGLLLITLTYFYIKEKTNKYNALLAVLFLSSSYLFLERGFRVRSDLLCSSLSCILLMINLHCSEQRKNQLIVPLLLLLLLITPKSIYWFVLTSLLLLKDSKKHWTKWISLKSQPVYITLGGFVCVSFLFKDPFFIKAFSDSFNFYVLNLKLSSSFIFKYNLMTYFYDYAHIGFFIKNNPILVFIVCFNLVLMLHSLMRSKKIGLHETYFLTLLCITLLHPHPKLFFLSALAPFFIISLFTDQQWLFLLKNFYNKEFKTVFLAGVFLYSFCYISYFNYRVLNIKNNQIQKQTISHLNTFYKDTSPQLSILDPLCLIYSRKTTCKYLLYNHSLNLKDYIQEKRFDIILVSNKFSILNLMSIKFEKFKYVQIQNMIYYKALIVDIKTDLHLYASHPKSLQNQKSSLSSNSSTPLPLFLSAKKVFKVFSKQNLPFFSEFTDTQLAQRPYYYFYIDGINRVLQEKNSVCKKTQSQFLLPGCFYREQEFKNSLIPIENKNIAVFYAPFPFDLNKDFTTIKFLRYDFW